MAVHSYGFEKDVTVCSASVTCGKATFISPIQVEHSALAFEAANNQCDIGCTKASGVRQNHTHVGFATGVKYKIQIATFIRVVEINRWRQHTIAYGQQRKNSFNGTGGTQQMPGHGFGATHSQSSRVTAKYTLGRGNFGHIADLC